MTDIDSEYDRVGVLCPNLWRSRTDHLGLFGNVDPLGVVDGAADQEYP